MEYLFLDQFEDAKMYFMKCLEEDNRFRLITAHYTTLFIAFDFLESTIQMPYRLPESIPRYESLLRSGLASIRKTILCP